MTDPTEGGQPPKVPCIECEGRGCATCVQTGWLYAVPPRLQVAVGPTNPTDVTPTDSGQSEPREDEGHDGAGVARQARDGHGPLDAGSDPRPRARRAARRDEPGADRVGRRVDVDVPGPLVGADSVRDHRGGPAEVGRAIGQVVVDRVGPGEPCPGFRYLPGSCCTERCDNCGAHHGVATVARAAIVEPVRSIVAALVNAGRSPDEAIDDVRAVLDHFGED